MARKTLNYIVFVLIVANVVIMALALFGKPSGPRQSAPPSKPGGVPQSPAGF